MNKRKKMIVGIASLAGAACAAGVTAKVADCIKRKWFSQGYDAGHLVGFMDGGIAMAKKYDNGSRLLSLAEITPSLRKSTTSSARTMTNWSVNTRNFVTSITKPERP